MHNSLRTLEAHEEVLGILLNEPELIKEYAPRLKPELFLEYDWLYRIMQDVEESEGLTYNGVLRNKKCPVDRMTEVEMLKNTFFNENRIGSLVKEMKKNQIKHNLYTIGTEMVSRINGSDADELLREVQDTVLALNTSDSEELSNADQDVDKWAAHMIEIADDPMKAYGILTNIHALDKITTGFHRQHFSVLGGYTSMGKTAIVLEILLRMNMQKYKCAIFSLEMSKRDLYTRMMSNLMQINNRDFKMGRLERKKYDDMLRFKDELKSIYVDDTRGMSVDQIVDKIKYLKRKQGIDFVVVDYIQDVSEQGEQNDNAGSAIARICRKLRKVCLETDCHIMGLSQVSRGIASREDKRPKVSDLAGSTGIETSADVIMLAYRDEYYNPETSKKGIVEIEIAKHRNGEIGKLELKFDKTTQKITDY